MFKKQKLRNSCTTQCNLSHLPDELLIHIFGHLQNFGDLANFGMCNKNLLRVSKTSEFYPKFCTHLFNRVGGLSNTTIIWDSEDYQVLWFKLVKLIKPCWYPQLQTSISFKTFVSPSFATSIPKCDGCKSSMERTLQLNSKSLPKSAHLYLQKFTGVLRIYKCTCPKKTYAICHETDANLHSEIMGCPGFIYDWKQELEPKNFQDVSKNGLLSFRELAAIPKSFFPSKHKTKIGGWPSHLHPQTCQHCGATMEYKIQIVENKRQTLFVSQCTKNNMHFALYYDK